MTLKQVKDNHILQTLIECHGETKKAALVLGITQRSIYNWMKENDFNHRAHWTKEYRLENRYRHGPGVPWGNG